MIRLSPALAATGAATSTEWEFLFHSPGWLWALLPLPLLLFLRLRRGTSASIMHPGLRMIAAQLHKPRNLFGVFGPLLMTLAAAALIVALARPQIRNRHEEQVVSGIDIMIVCDLSGSMAERDMLFQSTDRNGRRIRSTVDRLTAAKQVVNEFIEGRPNDRIGLVAFAGKAKLCSPLTLDQGIVRYIIDQFYLASHSAFGFDDRPGYIKEDGTAIGTAIATAATRLHARKETKSKIIILVTDGVSNRGKISPLDAARLASEMGIKIFTIAIGQDQRLSNYTANIDTLDEKTLKKIARVTHGQYFRASSGDSLQEAFSTIDEMEKSEAKRRVFQSFTELFRIPLWCAAVLLLLSCILTFTRPRPAP